MHRRQTKEQLCVSDAMDLRYLEFRVTQAHYCEALPPSPGSLWTAVIPRPPRPFFAQSVPSSYVIDLDEVCWISNALQENALAFHQMTLSQGVVNPSDPRHLELSTSPGEMSRTHPSNSSLRNSP